MDDVKKVSFLVVGNESSSKNKETAIIAVPFQSSIFHTEAEATGNKLANAKRGPRSVAGQLKGDFTSLSSPIQNGCASRLSRHEAGANARLALRLPVVAYWQFDFCAR